MTKKDAVRCPHGLKSELCNKCLRKNLSGLIAKVRRLDARVEELEAAIREHQAATAQSSEENWEADRSLHAALGRAFKSGFTLKGDTTKDEDKR